MLEVNNFSAIRISLASPALPNVSWVYSAMRREFSVPASRDGICSVMRMM